MIRGLSRAAILAAIAMTTASAQAPSRSIWVLAAKSQQPAILQIDPKSFNVLRTVALPKIAIDHPEYLSVNATGQLLWSLPGGIELADAVETAGMVWFFSGGMTPTVPRQATGQQSRVWYLSANGGNPYVLETRDTKTFNADGNDATVMTSAQLLRATGDLASVTTVVALPALPLCKCGTGVCSETCPQWQVWAPDNGIGDSFLATKFVAGQLQTNFDETLVYHRARGWRPTRLAEPIESPLDASADGQTIVTAVYDSGCCGWVNESSDQLQLIRNGKSTLVFDEHRRFDNRNYDVTFTASNAKLSPAGAEVAYTITASQSASDEIRLSVDGKDNPQELARVKQTIGSLPIVEIISATTSRAIATIPRAELAGWLGDNEVLVVQDGRLAAFDTRTTTMRRSSIEVGDIKSVFVR